MSKKLIVVSTLLLMALLAAACGTDDPTATPTRTSEPTSTATATPTSESPGSDATTGDGDTMVKDDDGDAMMKDAWELSILNFSHADATITVGSTVKWTNTGSAQHTATSGAPEAATDLWDSGALSTNSTYSYTFDDTGTFAYYCKFHSSMVATITVVAEGEDATGGAEGTPKSGGDGGLYD